MHTRSNPFAALLVAACLTSFATEAAGQIKGTGGHPSGLKNPFYAFNNSMRGKQPSDPAAQAGLLAELGYDGIEGYSLDELPRLAEEMHKRELKVATIYFKVDLDAKDSPYDQRIVGYLRTFLKDRGVILTVHLHSKRFKPSDPEGDAVAVPILRELADLAHANGAKVAVYNHVGVWAESIDDGIRLSKKVNRRNFGAAFNLCHWLSLEGEVDLGKRLDAIAPYLLSVTLCGADGGPGARGASWDKLIQPLDQGSFDNFALLKEIVKRGYRGPIGLQCFNISLPARDHLTRSIQAWSALKQRFTTRAGNSKESSQAALPH
ncbi:MAG: TIM barrel protein [bacterium]